MTETDAAAPVGTEPAVPTLLGRLVGAGLNEAKARRWIETEAVTLDGQRVSDPETPAPPGTRPVINPR